MKAKFKHAADRKNDDIRKEYASVIKSQKERITQLRDDNAVLAKKISELENYKSEMVNALMEAQKRSAEIIREAHTRAEQIVKDAEHERSVAEKTAFLYHSSLKELESRSEKILLSIRKELSRDRTPNIRIVSQ